MEYSEIIIPDLGLYSHYPKEQVPRTLRDGHLHIGLSYARNISLSRKEGCLSKSFGLDTFTSSATGSTDSVRGIGILDPYARSVNYQAATSKLKSPAANGDDGDDDGRNDERDQVNMPLSKSGAGLEVASGRYYVSRQECAGECELLAAGCRHIGRGGPVCID